MSSIDVLCLIWSRTSSKHAPAFSRYAPASWAKYPSFNRSLLVNTNLRREVLFLIAHTAEVGPKCQDQNWNRGKSIHVEGTHLNNHSSPSSMSHLISIPVMRGSPASICLHNISIDTIFEDLFIYEMIYLCLEDPGFLRWWLLIFLLVGACIATWSSIQRSIYHIWPNVLWADW